MASAKLKAKYRTISHLSTVDIYQMYSVYSRYYKGTKWRIFMDDLSKKSGAFVIRRRKDNKVVGFSTIVSYDLVVEGKKVSGVFSGDTIIDKEYWGSRVLQVAFYKYMIARKIKSPNKSIYWLLISKGFKTYLLMANNFDKYYPNPEYINKNLSGVVDYYCDEIFPENYDKEKKILDFGRHYQALKEGVAEIDKSMLVQNHKIRFFEQCNPEWRRGTELPCVGVVDWSLLLKYVVRFLRKPTSKGKTDHQTRDAVSVAQPHQLDSQQDTQPTKRSA